MSFITSRVAVLSRCVGSTPSIATTATTTISGRTKTSGTSLMTTNMIRRRRLTTATVSKTRKFSRELTPSIHRSYWNTASSVTAIRSSPVSSSYLFQQYLQRQQQNHQQSLQNRWFSSSILMWGSNPSKGATLLPPKKDDDTTATVPTIEGKVVKSVPYECDTSNTDTIEAVICGPTETALITTTGELYVMGENKNGQCGVGHSNPLTSLTKVQLESNDDEEDGNDDDDTTIRWKSAAFGSSASAYVTTDGELYTSGSNGTIVSGGIGILGLGSASSTSVLKPQRVESLIEDGCEVQDVLVGESHMTVLTTEGEVLTTGAASYGRLGNGETSIDNLYLEPIEMLVPESSPVEQIVGGKSFTLALSKNDGIIYGWGRNHKGQLGTGFGMAVDMYSMEQVPYPIESDELINRKVVKIAAGSSHAACITDQGQLFVWGMSIHLEPVLVTEVLHTKIVDVQCGRDITFALSEDNHVYVWGKHGKKTGLFGLEAPSSNTIHQPKLIPTLQEDAGTIQSLSVGWSHAACLTSS